MTIEQDDTDHVLSSARLAHGVTARLVQAARPATTQLTPLQERVLDRIDGQVLPYISNPLIYADLFYRQMTRPEHRAAASLFKGGFARYMKVFDARGDYYRIERVNHEQC